MNESIERVGSAEKVVAGIGCAGDTAARCKSAQTEQILEHAEGVERLRLLLLLLMSLCARNRLRSDGLACTDSAGATEGNERLAAERHRAAKDHLEGVDKLGLLQHLRLLRMRGSLRLGCGGAGHCTARSSRRRRRSGRLWPLLPLLHGLQWLQGQIERIEQHVE